MMLLVLPPVRVTHKISHFLGLCCYTIRAPLTTWEQQLGHRPGSHCFTKLSRSSIQIIKNKFVIICDFDTLDRELCDVLSVDFYQCLSNRGFIFLGIALESSFAV